MEIRNQKARREWIQTVDTATSTRRRDELERSFRKDIEKAQEDALLSDSFSNTRRSIERIPDGILVAAIMSSGYDHGLAVFAELKRVGKATDLVRVGHSSHSYSGWKYFSNGGMMSSRQLYVTSRDRDKIIAAKNSPLLLVDDVEESGLTLAMTGGAIRQRLGHVGELWTWVGIVGPSTPFGRRSGVSRYSGMSWVPQIATELGEE